MLVLEFPRCLDPTFFAEKTPGVQVPAPKAVNILRPPGWVPVAQQNPLVPFQSGDQPVGQASGMAGEFERTRPVGLLYFRLIFNR